MKRAAALILLILIASLASAQARVNPGELVRRLSLEEEDIAAIEEVILRANRTVLPARAQIQVLQSELTYLLTQGDVDMDEVEKILRASLEWELQMRLAEVEKQIAIRGVLGSEKWTRLMQTVRQLRESGNLAALIERAEGDSRTRRILVIIRDMARF